MSLDIRAKPQLLIPCYRADELHRWIRLYTGLRVSREPICPGHAAPFEYLRLAYFEPSENLVVWAPRGGGKTRLAAVLTLLDLLHKPHWAVRLIGGSLNQSLLIWERLLPDLESLAAKLISSRRDGHRIRLVNGSSAAVLAQSQRAVRGLRVHKLRCDEVEMFKPEIWEAAQLVTRSSHGIRGSIEAISTHHALGGLMGRIIDEAPARGMKILKWCLMEVLEKCPPDRDCATCPLWDDCRGVAKEKCDGFFSIDDAIAMKKRVSAETWEAEMLCRRPSVSGCVFPSFSPELHVRELPNKGDASLYLDSELCLGIDFGFGDPFVCLWIRRFADDQAHVIDEYVQPQRTMDEHLEQIQSRQHGPVLRACCDPAGASRNQQTAMSNIQLLRAAGLRPRYRGSRIVEGLEMIRAALRPAHGPARLFIHPRCVRLIRAMQCYRYPSGGGELPIKDGEHDHLIDALRYYFVNRTGGDAEPRRY
jgi:hypothetical protein